MMNARNLLAAMLLVLPFTTWAQDDDMYFVPKKAKKAKTEQRAEVPQRYLPVEIIYEDEFSDDDTLITTAGSNRDVDEYNRRVRHSTPLAGEMVQNPDGTFTYRVPASDTLYVMNDSTAITTDALAQELYTRGYEAGMADGEDYAYSRRIGRFGYGGAYASPWYYSYYDPFYWDDWYYHPYHGYYGLYHWGYPYYRGYYSPYWYGGYYGWGYPYHNGYYSYGSSRPRGNTYGGRGGSIRGGRAEGYVNGRANGSRSVVGVNGRNSSTVNGGRATGYMNRGRANSSYENSGSRSGSIINNNRSTTAGRSESYSNSSSSRSSSTISNSGSTRSVGTFSGSSSSSGGFSGGGRAGGGGGGFSGGGGSSRGGGGGGGRGGR